MGLIRSINSFPPGSAFKCPKILPPRNRECLQKVFSNPSLAPALMSLEGDIFLKPVCMGSCFKFSFFYPRPSERSMGLQMDFFFFFSSSFFSSSFTPPNLGGHWKYESKTCNLVCQNWWNQGLEHSLQDHQTCVLTIFATDDTLK